MSMIKTSIDEKELCREKICPTCGGIECLERPRYFSGQLLTDKDLDAAQRYVIEKNRLHNRYLVGTGVVCGLAVRCDPGNKGAVVVESGYAIDCCGNDIVLCESKPFDVAEYIEKCLKKKKNGCEDNKTKLSSRCDDVPKEYCIVLSYNEEPARPVTALIRDNGCSASRCEPSRTKEKFRLDLIERKDEKDTKPLNIWDKLKACVTEVFTKFSEFNEEISAAQEKLENKEINLQQFHETVFKIFCDMKDYVLKLYEKGPNIRCNIAAELKEIEDSFPASISDPEYQKKIYTAIFRMYARILQYIIDCICDALLVPCVECGEEEGVILACLTVHNGKVEKICNMERQFIIAGPALRYWLGPLYASFGNAMEYLCCEFDPDDFFGRIFQPKTRGAMGAKVAFNRSETAFRMGREYAASALKGLKTFDFFNLTDPEAITPMNLFNRPKEDVQGMLTKKNVTVVEKCCTTHAEAYSLKNLTEMDWVIPPSSRVELVISPDNLVTAVRVIKEEGKK